MRLNLETPFGLESLVLDLPSLPSTFEYPEPEPELYSFADASCDVSPARRRPLPFSDSR
mgnify:CR=1 FL=1